MRHSRNLLEYPKDERVVLIVPLEQSRCPYLDIWSASSSFHHLLEGLAKDVGNISHVSWPYLLICSLATRNDMPSKLKCLIVVVRMECPTHHLIRQYTKSVVELTKFQVLSKHFPNGPERRRFWNTVITMHDSAYWLTKVWQDYCDSGIYRHCRVWNAPKDIMNDCPFVRLS